MLIVQTVFAPVHDHVMLLILVLWVVIAVIIEIQKYKYNKLMDPIHSQLYSYVMDCMI